MVQLSERMISLGLEGVNGLTQPEREALKAVFSTIVIKMKVFQFLFQCPVINLMICEFYISQIRI